MLSLILPNTVIRLSIINTSRGIPLFSCDLISYNEIINDDLYKEIINEDLFSSMISAISIIMNESLKKGGVREIRLDNAHLLLKKHDKGPVLFVLVALKVTKFLRESLDCFANRFITLFGARINDDFDTSKFALPAQELVSKYFPLLS
jgi:hypothetical protein